MVEARHFEYGIQIDNDKYFTTNDESPQRPCQGQVAIRTHFLDMDLLGPSEKVTDTVGFDLF